MRRQEVLWFGLLVAVAASIGGDALAQTTDPTAGLQSVGESSMNWIYNTASVIGAAAAGIGGVLAYAGFIPRDWVKNILVISGFIIVVPQVVKIIFEQGTPASALGGFGG